MCFRPASTGKVIRCPQCNMIVQPTAKTCKKCGAELTGADAPLKPPVLKKSE